MTIKILDPLGLNGMGGTYRKLSHRKSYYYNIGPPYPSDFERVPNSDERYKNDSLKSKKYFSRQETVEKKVDKLFKDCLKDIKRGTLELVGFSCSNDELLIKIKQITK